MSKEIQIQQKKLDKAFFAKGFSLFRGNPDLIMIEGIKNKEEAHIVMTVDGAKEMTDQVNKEIKENGEE
jgi:hypothetical protein